MARGLKDEIKQKKPFVNLEEEAHLNIARTFAHLEHAMIQALKPHDITPTQYNVLRILRGAGPVGLCRNEIGERLVRRVPDVTRLLDRMEDAGLVARERSATDRREVRTRVTTKGLALVERLDEPMRAINRSRLGHLDAASLQTLVKLLTKVRDP